MTEMFGAKSEEEFLTSPFYAPVRQAMMAKKDVIERLAAKKQVGGPMPEDEGNPDTVNSAADNADAVDAYASLGGLSAMDLTDPKQISQAILANAAKQQQYYDNLANEIKQRRYGPSESEKLLALSSAFFSPTSVRGFSGTMGNVLPVLQKFGELKRTGEEERNEALQALAKQRMALAQGDVKTALDLQRLLATYNKKPSGAKPRATVGADQRVRHSVYGTEITPPTRKDLYNLKSFLNDPNVTDQQREEAKANFDDTYGVGAAEVYGGEE
jgi:hypothetical protein